MSAAGVEAARRNDVILATTPMRLLICCVACALTSLAQDGVLTRINAHADHFGAISRQIWELPELGFHEDNSSAILRNELRQAGFKVDEAVAGMPT